MTLCSVFLYMPATTLGTPIFQARARALGSPQNLHLLYCVPATCPAGLAARCARTCMPGPGAGALGTPIFQARDPGTRMISLNGVSLFWEAALCAGWHLGC